MREREWWLRIDSRTGDPVKGYGLRVTDEGVRVVEIGENDPTPQEFKQMIRDEMIKHTRNRGWRGFKRWERNILKMCGFDDKGNPLEASDD